MRELSKTKVNLLFASISILLTSNLGSQPFVKQAVSGLPDLYKSSAQWGDYDNDGDLDLLLNGKLEKRGDHSVNLYKNNGNNTFEEIAFQGTAINYGARVCWNDYNNDGWLDCLIPIAYSNSCIYVNDKNSSFTKHSNDTLPNATTLVFVDFDNDGDQDIAFSDREQYLFENINGDFEELDNEMFNTGTEDFQSAWGDYNNDGFIDILTTSWTQSPYKGFTNVYKNNMNSGFTRLTNTGLHDFMHGALAWADYDGDGDLDALITGTSTSYKTKLYRNNGQGSFTRQSISFLGVQGNSVAWGDYDNDGDLDLLYSASSSVPKLYKNNGNNTFTEIVNANLPANEKGAVVTWADYDNDGDLDILISGHGKTELFRNDVQTPNEAPGVPTGLRVSSFESHSVVRLTWEAASDDTTPVPSLTYNVRVGTSPGGCDIVSPMAGANGYRRVVGMGNGQLGTFFILKDLAPGTYYWSVQAVDNSYAGGAFAEEQTLTITQTAVDDIKAKDFILFPNPATDHVTVNCEGFIKAEIIDPSGNCVIESANSQIDINSLSPGLYIAKVKTTFGTAQTKLIKK